MQLSAGEITAPWGDYGEEFQLSAGLFFAYVRDALGDSTGGQWQDALMVMKDMASYDEDKKQAAIVKVLDKYCSYQGTKIWHEYGICIGSGNMELAAPVAVLGADFS